MSLGTVRVAIDEAERKGKKDSPLAGAQSSLRNGTSKTTIAMTFCFALCSIVAIIDLSF